METEDSKIGEPETAESESEESETEEPVIQVLVTEIYEHTYGNNTDISRVEVLFNSFYLS